MMLTFGQFVESAQLYDPPPRWKAAGQTMIWTNPSRGELRTALETSRDGILRGTEAKDLDGNVNFHVWDASKMIHAEAKDALLQSGRHEFKRDDVTDFYVHKDKGVAAHGFTPTGQHLRRAMGAQKLPDGTYGKFKTFEPDNWEEIELA